MPQESQEYRQIENDYQRKIAIVTWRDRLVRVVLGAVIFLEIGAAAFFLWSCGWYIVQTSFSDRALFAQTWRNFSSFSARLVAAAPKSLVLGQATAVSAVDGVDIVASLENPNDTHYAVFLYSFLTDQGETEKTPGFIGPGETKYVAAFGSPSVRSSNVRLRVSQVIWSEIDRHAIASVSTWMSDRLNFPVTNITYQADLHKSATVSFSLQNLTTFSYWEPAFTVLLSRGSAILGVARVTVPQFMQGDTRTVTTQWLGDYPSTVTVKVVPDIDVFDPTVYK